MITVTLSKKVERSRPVDKLDRFFIVDVHVIPPKDRSLMPSLMVKAVDQGLLGASIPKYFTLTCCWIEKEFTESKFIKDLMDSDKDLVWGEIKKITVRKEFDNEAEYRKYKRRHDLP